MNAGQRSVRQLANNSLSLAKGPVCRSCRESISRRNYASAAAAVVEEPTAIPHVPPVAEASHPAQAYQLRAGVVLSRPPQITRDLHPFEKAYFLYQRRLNERLALPFTRYFYFKKGTPADLEWKRKVKARSTAARDIGVYNAYSKDGWNDELLVGAQESDPDQQIDALLKDGEVPGIGSGEIGEAAKKEPVERPMPRVTEADEAGDQKSLNRLLQRTLYLVVRNGDGSWAFPSDSLAGRESLHQAAERVLVHAGGVNMNTWVVGNAPVGHYHYDYSKSTLDPEKNLEELGQRIFFMKARIMAGQANIEGNKLGLSDFKWLAKEEIEKAVIPRYWSAIRNVLPER